MDPVPETEGVEEEVEQNKIDGDGEEGNKESEEVEELGAPRDEDGDKGVAIGSRYVWTLNCASKVIQLVFKPDGVTASKLSRSRPRRGWKEGELTMEEFRERDIPTPGDGGKQLDTFVDPASSESENDNWV
ncbi:hypothetical protein BC835DRAFT_1309814 [Cytidiella melzeri]|nr:hypothetical protein BC835DRAFT_1309814 [Cytidiella melzeri]